MRSKSKQNRNSNRITSAGLGRHRRDWKGLCVGIGEQRRRVEIGFRRKHLITRSFDTERKKTEKIKAKNRDRRLKKKKKKKGEIRCNYVWEDEEEEEGMRAEWKAWSVGTGSVPQMKPTTGLGFAISSFPTHCSSLDPSQALSIEEDRFRRRFGV